nr:MAG TPA: hypothetical protein [Caudoviricetes sp.]
MIIRPLTLSAWKLEGFFRCVGDMGVCGAEKP